ncbi:MAG: DNA-directed RNA polymerase specialized sigma24 family protein, partial [Planctomycetota bacterium]
MTAFRDTGREDVFETMYRQARASMLRWISQLMATRRQDGDPFEVLQDTFINIFRYARSFRSEEGNSFRGWARTIAANVIRRASMKRRLVYLSALPDGVSEPIDERAGPQQNCQSNEATIHMSKAWTLLLLHYAS